MRNQAIVGGVALHLVDLAQHHIVERAHLRGTTLEENELRSRGLAGVAAGRRELLAALAEGATELAALHDELAGRRDRSPVGDIPIDFGAEAPELTD